MLHLHIAGGRPPHHLYWYIIHVLLVYMYAYAECYTRRVQPRTQHNICCRLHNLCFSSQRGLPQKCAELCACVQFETEISLTHSRASREHSFSRDVIDQIRRWKLFLCYSRPRPQRTTQCDANVASDALRCGCCLELELLFVWAICYTLCCIIWCYRGIIVCLCVHGYADIYTHIHTFCIGRASSSSSTLRCCSTCVDEFALQKRFYT